MKAETGLRKSNGSVGMLLPEFYKVNNGNHDTSDFGKILKLCKY